MQQDGVNYRLVKGLYISLKQKGLQGLLQDTLTSP